MFRGIVIFLICCWAVTAQASLIIFDGGSTGGPPYPTPALELRASVNTAPMGQPPQLETVDSFEISILNVTPELPLALVFQNPAVEIAAEKANELVGAEGSDYKFGIKFPLAGIDALFTDVRVRPSSSFDLFFGTQSRLGSASYLFHFDSAQQLDFSNLAVTLATDRKSFELDFTTTLTGPVIGGEPSWSAGLSGDLTSAPEPTTLALLGFGLIGVGHARRRRLQ